MCCGILNWPKPDGINTVVFDLDGVLAKPQWPTRHVVGDPIPEGLDLLKHYAGEGYQVEIHTARPEWDKPIVRAWLEKNKLMQYVDALVCGKKPAAGLYIDDRGWNPYYTKQYKKEEVDVC